MRDEPTESQPRLGLPAAAAFYGVMLAVAFGWAALTEKGPDLLLAWPAQHAVAWWLAGLGVGLCLVALTAVAESRSAALRRLGSELGALVAPATPLRIAVLALASGIAEEALFRGPVQHTLGYVAASVGFALLHGGISPRYIAWSTFALVAGLSFGLLAEAYQSVWPAALAHAVVNGINLRRLGRHPAGDDLA